MSLEIVGVPIPGAVILHYMTAYYTTAQSVPVKSIYASLEKNVPAFPIPKEVFKARLKRTMLPAVCGNCHAVVGQIEGGRLEWGCHRCESAEHTTWLRVNAISAYMKEWAHDPIACVIIAAVEAARKNKEVNNAF